MTKGEEERQTLWEVIHDDRLARLRWRTWTVVDHVLHGDRHMADRRCMDILIINYHLHITTTGRHRHRWDHRNSYQPALTEGHHHQRITRTTRHF